MQFHKGQGLLLIQTRLTNRRNECMEEKTVFIRLKEWCGQEKNQWKIAPFFRLQL